MEGGKRHVTPQRKQKVLMAEDEMVYQEIFKNKNT